MGTQSTWARGKAKTRLEGADYRRPSIRSTSFHVLLSTRYTIINNMSLQVKEERLKIKLGTNTNLKTCKKNITNNITSNKGGKKKKKKKIKKSKGGKKKKKKKKKK